MTWFWWAMIAVGVLALVAAWLANGIFGGE